MDIERGPERPERVEATGVHLENPMTVTNHSDEEGKPGAYPRLPVSCMKSIPTISRSLPALRQGNATTSCVVEKTNTTG